MNDPHVLIIMLARAFGIALLGGIVMYLSSRYLWRSKPKVAVVGAIAVLTIGFSFGALPAIMNFQRPAHIVLTDTACTEIHRADAQSGNTSKIAPCAFSMYVKPEPGVLMGYGSSENVRGQCLIIPTRYVKAITPEFYGERLAALPSKCISPFAGLYPDLQPTSETQHH